MSDKKKNLIVIESDLHIVNSLKIVLSLTSINLKILHFLSPEKFQKWTKHRSPEDEIRGFICNSHFLGDVAVKDWKFLHSIKSEFTQSFFILWTDSDITLNLNGIIVIPKSSDPVKLLELINEFFR